MDNFKEEFPGTKVYTYLNTAATGLLSEKVLEFRQEHGMDLLVAGDHLPLQGKITTQTRQAVATFFNASPGQVALIPNFSLGFNILMEGVNPSAKVLLIKDDYPSVEWAVESRGFETVYVEASADLEERIVEMVEKQRPELFIFSLVQWISGIKIEEAFLRKLKSDFPDLLLIADGTQYCGMEQFDFEASALDALGSSTYKWLNAGFGSAFFLFKEDNLKSIAPKAVGYGSRMGPYKEDKDTLIGKFESGHLDGLSFGSLLVALEHLTEIGMNRVQEQVRQLSLQAKEAFRAAGLLPLEIANRPAHSSIFNIKGDDKLFNKLRSQGILCAQRGNGIRVSFHYYNDSQDLERLMKVVTS